MNIPATAQDFINWETKAKECSYTELVFIIRDCEEAMEAMKGWNPVRESYYADQRFTFIDELRRRMRQETAVTE